MWKNIETKWDCINLGAEWENSFLNFDNIANAMSSLFIVSNAVQWQEIMYYLEGVTMRPKICTQICTNER
jgi:hypothetical protein